MKVKIGYGMGYAGTDEEWVETIPEDVVAEGQEAIEEYLDGLQDEAYATACERISVWATIVE
jgi:hypothetical protein